tara:strand:- start:64 stop:936 length:873 start_codon:yes stop_codon:yes gene_type:complete
VSRILVTGGAGFIGKNLIKRLVSENNFVVSVDNYFTGTVYNHINGCEYLDADCGMENYGNIFQEYEFDVIYHLAAYARIQPSLKQPRDTIENNFTGTLNILEFARCNDIQVIYAGSSSKHHGLYGSPYAWSKYGGEQLCYLYSSVYDMNTTICRFYNVYGDSHIRTGEYATVVGLFEQQYMDKQPLTIVGDGEQRRDFTHVDDIVDGLIRCMGKDFRAEEFELGSSSNYSINQLANMFGRDYPKKYIPKRDGEYPLTLCTDYKAHDLLGWKPKGNLKKYIKEWIDEYKTK